MHEHREGSAVDFLSPNWCDPTTWHSAAERVISEAATDTGDGLTWTLPHSPLIDVVNGRITQEHRLHASHGAIVTVDGQALAEKTRPNGMVGDFAIDYAAGSITFGTSQAGADVRATYSRGAGSRWTIKPDPGRRLRLTAVEVQFSADVELLAAVRFEIYGSADVFAPGQYPAGTLIPLGSRVYQTIQDYINESQRSFPDIPAMGGAGWRGTQTSTHVFRWPYAEDATRDLDASAGMEVRISLDGDQALGGSRAYATVYATSEAEA